jgi:cold shock CspA family protein
VPCGARRPELGTVIWYDGLKGFIKRDDGSEFYVRANVVRRAGLAGLIKGQRVAIDVGVGRRSRRLEVVVLRLVNDA